MTTQALGTFIQVYTFAGEPVPGYAWHNYIGQQTLEWENESYLYAGFGFSGASINIDSASIEATLVFGHSQLGVDIFENACKQRYNCIVTTVWFDPNTDLPASEFSKEYYSFLSYADNLDRISVTIGDPLNAVDAQVPKRVLTQKLIGNAPPSGTILL